MNLSGNHPASFKVKDDEFEEMSDRSALHPAPYLVRNKWIMAENPNALSSPEWERYLTQSYNLIKSKLSLKVRTRLSSNML